MTVNKRNLYQIKDFIEFGLKIDIKNFRFGFFIPTGRGRKLKNLMLTQYEFEFLKRKIKKYQKEYEKKNIKIFFYVPDKNKKEYIEEIKKGKDEKIKENIDKIVKIYEALKYWKFKSNDVDEWFKREELWKRISKIFRNLTGKKFEDLTRNWHGSGYNVEKFLNSLIKNEK